MFCFLLVLEVWINIISVSLSLPISTSKGCPSWQLLNKTVRWKVGTSCRNVFGKAGPLLGFPKTRIFSSNECEAISALHYIGGNNPPKVYETVNRISLHF